MARISFYYFECAILIFVESAFLRMSSIIVSLEIFTAFLLLDFNRIFSLSLYYFMVVFHICVTFQLKSFSLRIQLFLLHDFCSFYLFIQHSYVFSALLLRTFLATLILVFSQYLWTELISFGFLTFLTFLSALAFSIVLIVLLFLVPSTKLIFFTVFPSLIALIFSNVPTFLVSIIFFTLPAFLIFSSDFRSFLDFICLDLFSALFQTSWLLLDVILFFPNGFPKFHRLMSCFC